MIKYRVHEGKNPKTDQPMFFAMCEPVSVIKLDTLAREISQECTVTEHDIRAVVSAMEERIIAHLQNGQSVRLGQLGSFCPSIRSDATETAEGFTNANIKRLCCNFHPSATIKYKLSVGNPDMQFYRSTPAPTASATV